MPGRVAEVLVEQGDTVRVGQVEAGVPGVAWVRLDRCVPWPPELALQRRADGHGAGMGRVDDGATQRRGRVQAPAQVGRRAEQHEDDAQAQRRARVDRIDPRIPRAEQEDEEAEHGAEHGQQALDVAVDLGVEEGFLRRRERRQRAAQLAPAAAAGGREPPGVRIHAREPPRRAGSRL